MQVVDTLRCVKSLIPECEEFSLQFLRYELHLYKEEEALANSLDMKIQSHRALSDALHLLLLYKNLTQYATLSQLIEISSKPVLLEKLLFGKYKGRYIEEILHVDSSYIYWLSNNIENDEDLVYSIEFYRSNI
jgi:DNA polymerase-3 subunit epsilon/exodeoxyribonuclease X